MRATRAIPADGPVFEPLPARDVDLGPGERVRRVLPTAARRTVGPWCFVDLFGPLPPGHPLVVRAHPHIGLSTVTWLHSGAIVHRDSLGTRVTIRPGQLDLMTAGRGIAHSERRADGDAEPLAGIQLWLALPDDARHGPPAFVQLRDLPVAEVPGARITVLLGELAGAASPAPRHHPVLGAELALDGAARVPVDPDFEHGAVLLSGEAALADDALPARTLVHLGRGRTALALRGRGRVLLLGGAPFGEVLLWWNFVARTEAEVRAARAAWEAGGAGVFPPVPDEPDRIPAPPLPEAP